MLCGSFQVEGLGRARPCGGISQPCWRSSEEAGWLEWSEMDGGGSHSQSHECRSQIPSRCDERFGFYGDCWKPLEVRAGWCLLIWCPFHGFTLSAVLRVSLQWARGGAGKHTKIFGSLCSSPGKSWWCLHQGYNQEGVPIGWMLDVL